MRIVTCATEIPRVPAHAIHATLLCDDVLHTFHGPDTHIGPWVNGARDMAISLDASGSPIPLGPRIWSSVKQSWRPDGVSNRMQLKGSELMSIQSAWTVRDGHLAAEARIQVIPPFSWLAEPFVARKASSQMRAFSELVRSRCLAAASSREPPRGHPLV
jgi:hypothetical protein